MPATKSHISHNPATGGMVMVTSHGEHPPELYAEAAARQLAPLGDGLTGARLRAAQDFQNKIATVLEKHHNDLHSKEASLLSTRGMVHADAEVKMEDTEVEAAMAEISAAVKGTEWADNFTYGARPTWLDQREKDIDELGAENVEPLSASQQVEYDRYIRTQTIRQVIGTHMATHKHVRRRHHAHKHGAKPQ
jgi:hypothetical protein